MYKDTEKKTDTVGLDHCFENKIKDKFTVNFELLTQFTNVYIMDEKKEDLHELTTIQKKSFSTPLLITENKA